MLTFTADFFATLTVVTPYNISDRSKKQQVAEMFNNIAPRYDFLNHFLSLGIDILWRRKAIRLLKKSFSGKNSSHAPRLLDIATGTGDFAIEAMALDPEKVTGVDISEKMLAVGKEKIKKLSLENKIELLPADSEALPFENNSFDAITVGFGVRNFENLEKGLSEMHRVLRQNGSAVILEFSKPEKFPVKQLYHFYFKNILPLAGKIISKDNRAYTYLPESVSAFPHGKVFLEIMKKNGFRNVRQVPLSFGIASLYIGEK